MDGIPLWAAFSENDVFKIMMEDDLRGGGGGGGGGGARVIKKLLAQTEVGRQILCTFRELREDLSVHFELMMEVVGTFVLTKI